MKCPHCLEGFHDNREFETIGTDRDSKFGLVKRHCPECNRLILSLYRAWEPYGGQPPSYHKNNEVLIYPRTHSRAPLPPEVPSDFSEDYMEACLTLADSPKASAALSRRCLQHILREKAGVKKANLVNEIQEVIDEGKLPSYISEPLDAVRNIGNFAAHPMKSTSSGEVLPVETGEAEWNLEVIESLFDFYFVQPELLKKKKEALNQKLKDAGKPEMK